MFIFKIFIYLLNISPIESSESETLNEVSVILTTAEVHNNSNEYDNTIDCKNNQTHKLKKKLDLFFISLMILIFILFALLIVLCVKLIIRFCY